MLAPDRLTAQPLGLRLVASDLDGTLLRSDETISLYTRGVLDRVAALMPIVLVTARPPRRARLMAQLIGVAGRLICCNGALVYDTAIEAVVTHRPIAAVDARRLIEDLRAAVPGVCFAVELGLRYGCEPQYVELAGREGMVPDPEALIGDALDMCSVPVTKLIVRHATHDAPALSNALNLTVGDRFVTTYSGSTFVEISSDGVSKASALAAICEDLGIDREQVLAFGDMRNDLPMLRWAGRGIAVANAHPEVLAAVHDVTASNDEDGVAHALERLVLST